MFISHLVHVTLATDPRLLPQLAPEKEIKLGAAVKHPDYESLMERFREEVAEEIARAEAKEKFGKHLGTKLGLMEASEIKVAPLVPDAGAGDFKDCNLEMVVRLYDEGRRIVHRGDLLVRDLKRLKQAQILFQCVETVLAINAVRKYDVQLESPASTALAYACGRSLFGVPEPRLDKFMQKASKMFL